MIQYRAWNKVSSRDLDKATAIFVAMEERKLLFSKWQGTGNDFILVDDRATVFPAHDIPFIQQLCDRHFGIGSDGLILLQEAKRQGLDYHMEFYNPDGSRSFCGNGSRCAYAFRSALIGDRRAARFTAIDGEHSAAWRKGDVAIGMRDVASVERVDPKTDFIHTGSPHLLCWVHDPAGMDIVKAAHVHRYGPRFKTDGVNVNFLRWKDSGIEMRTYERGVEGETLSCGTGVTAAALSAMARGLSSGACDVSTPGGELSVEASVAGKGFADVSLIGPVRQVFNGEVGLPS